MTDVDYVEVCRQAHQLSSSHGWDAWKYAHRWANIAAHEGKLEESAFWCAVEAALKPR
jgi:hypothetical protein